MPKKTKSKSSKKKVQRIVIHGIDHARAACQAALSSDSAAHITLELWSARSAAGSLGPGWFGNIAEIVQIEFPDLAIICVLDCGDVRTRRPSMLDLMDYSDPSDILPAHFS
jgi:hypothetical protein